MPVLSLGKKSGRANIDAWLKKTNLTISEDRYDELIQIVKQKSIDEKRLITEKEFEEMVNSVK